MLFFPGPYLAIIGDIKNSRKIEDRGAVQEKLKEILEGVNEKYSSGIASKFTITLGDEFQGLLHDGADTLNILAEIERKMDPVRVRFGIGIGEITTNIDRERSIGADGPGYYRARDAIEFLKQSERKKQTGAADIRIEAAEAEQALISLLNTVLSLMAAVKNTWSARQRETIWVMCECRCSQAEAAKKLGITQSSVQKSLSHGNYYTYQAAMKTVEMALKEVGTRDV